MSRHSVVFLAALLALVLGGADAAAKKQGGGEGEPAAKAAPAGPPTWYAQAITHGDRGVALDLFWSKGRKLRAEKVVQGMNFITFVDGPYYTIIDVQAQSGVKIRRSERALAADRESPGERPFARDGQELKAAGAELIRSDTHGERPCRVYRVTDDLGKREVWISDDKQKLPLRVESFARTTGVEATTDYLDWRRDLPLPDSFFEPDPRFQLEEIGYDDYLKRSQDGPVGPAPVLFAPLLHGS